MNQPKKYDVFISYSRKDKKVVDMFVSRLAKEGFSVWIDKDGIESGDAFKHVIVNAIEQSTVVVFFSSAASNASMWTSKEIGVAIYENKPIIPVRLDDAKYNSEIKFDLINLDYIDVKGGKPSEEVFSRLIKTLSHKCNKQPGEITDDDPEKPDKKVGGISLDWPQIRFATLVIVTIILTGSLGSIFWIAVLVSYFSKNYRRLWTWTWEHQRLLWIIIGVWLGIIIIVAVLPGENSSSSSYNEQYPVVEEVLPEPERNYERKGYEPVWDYDTIAVDSVAEIDWSAAE